MGWFFSSDDGDDDSGDLFSGFFDLGVLIRNLLGGAGAIFGFPQEEEEEPPPFFAPTSAPRLSALSQKESDFYQKVHIVIGGDQSQIDPDSLRYEAHKLKLIFELEDEILFAGLPPAARLQKEADRAEFCAQKNLCPRCYERLEEGVCPYC